MTSFHSNRHNENASAPTWSSLSLGALCYMNQQVRLYDTQLTFFIFHHNSCLSWRFFVRYQCLWCLCILSLHINIKCLASSSCGTDWQSPMASNGHDLRVLSCLWIQDWNQPLEPIVELQHRDFSLAAKPEVFSDTVKYVKFNCFILTFRV